ncbi:Bladder cancer-related protein BC10 domain containing protein [Naviculisporaceae sp. PSN 640]
MFCLRSWLPLLFIPTNASPAFIFLFFVCTYFLNRPCVYCSFLLIVLFLTSCNWSDRCFFDFSSNWFEPRPGGSYIYLPLPEAWKGTTAAGGGNSTATDDVNATATAVVAEMLNTTVEALTTAATEKMAKTRVEWTGLGLEWLRSLLGRREWRIDCLDVSIRL